MTKDLEAEIDRRVALVSNAYLKTPDVTDAHDLIKRTRKLRRQCGGAFISLITGDSGSGKSTLFSNYEKAQETPLPDTRPVLRFGTPVPFSFSGLLEAMLTAMAVPAFAGRQDATQMRRRVLHYLAVFKVELILMEEASHIIDQKERSAKIPYAATDFIKQYFLDEAKVPIVLNGIPIAKELLFINPQMRQRTHGIVQLQLYSNEDLEQRERFMLAMEFFERKAGFPEAVLKDNDALCSRVLRATRGINGEIAKLFVQATEIGIRAGAQGLTPEVLALAHARLANPEKGWVNPFLVDVVPPAALPDETRVTQLHKRHRRAA